METLFNKKWILGILTACMACNILFAALFYVNDAKLGLGILLLFQIFYTIALLVHEQRCRKVAGQEAKRMNDTIKYAFFLTVFFSVFTFARGAEWGWKICLLATVIGSLLFIVVDVVINKVRQQYIP